MTLQKLLKQNFKSFFKDKPEFCIAKCIIAYLNHTKEIRGEIPDLFITYQNSRKRASRELISRWIKIKQFSKFVK